MRDYDPEKVADEVRRKLNARRKDQLFCSEEAVAYDRSVVRDFDLVSQEPPALDVEDQVMPNVPTSAVDPMVDRFDHLGRAG